MKHIQSSVGLVFGLILVMGILGCSPEEFKLSPTDPADMSASSVQLANFWVGRGQNKLGIYQGENFFQVQVLAGSYLLEYTTENGSYCIVFTASEDGAFLAIGLMPEDVLVSVTLLEGTIPGDAEPVEEKEGVSIYYRPGLELNFTCADVFVPPNPSVAPIVLVEDGEIVEGIEELPKVIPEVKEFTITVTIIGEGVVDPPGPVTRPRGSSKSFKFTPFPTAVTLNGEDVFDQVQKLGNGDGHLVIHDIQEDIEMIVTFVP